MSRFKWWQKVVFYQIYPRSFADGNRDGIGDFLGMTSKLDYLKGLGVTALWLSPHFPSPLWDCGYDISDYTSVAPEYGSLEDFNTFLSGAHRRGMRVILDLVLNHTSDQHPWFLESKSSRDNPKSSWYVWVDRPPNNWQSCFDGPAWTYAAERDQYYYHYFMKQQPDLNWHHPEVKNAMWQAVRFWLDLGVDGFRLDAVGTIFEHPDRPNHPVPMTLAELRHFSDVARTPLEKKLVAKYWREMFMFQWGHPHDLLKELRLILDEYPGDRMLVGEDDDVSYQGNGKDELSLVFNFPLLHAARLSPAIIRKNQKERLAALAQISPLAWPCNTLGNHDSPRLFNHFGDGQHDAELARLHLALMLTLRGTPFLYNGEEIGMTDFILTALLQFRDQMGIWYYHTAVDDLGVNPQLALQRAAAMTRNKNRTPMQWAPLPNGGFCPPQVLPWLPVNPNRTKGVNVEDQDKDPSSLLNFYRRMLRIRRASPALVVGEYSALHERSRSYLAFLRYTNDQTILVILNFSPKMRSLNFSELAYNSLRMIFRSALAAPAAPTMDLEHVRLAPFEIVLIELVRVE
ncbi:MAG: alpha-glucosidase [Anaerolineales bacterium]|jgi:alpha-glucosidase